MNTSSYLGGTVEWGFIIVSWANRQWLQIAMLPPPIIFCWDLTTGATHLSGTRITGTSESMAKVLYTDGSCDIKPQPQLLGGFSIFGPSCKQISSAQLDMPSSPAFSCGIQVNGTSSCPLTGGFLKD